MWNFLISEPENYSNRLRKDVKISSRVRVLLLANVGSNCVTRESYISERIGAQDTNIPQNCDDPRSRLFLSGR